MNKKLYIAEIIIFIIYLVILFMFILMCYDSKAYVVTKKLKSIFLDSSHNASTNKTVVNFTQINSLESVKNYTELIFLPNLFAPSDGDNTRTSEGNTSTKIHKIKNDIFIMMGLPNIRQIRIKNGTCEVPYEASFIANICHAENKFDLFETSSNEDKKNEQLNNEYLMWVYQDGSQLNTTSVVGELTIYPSGGYVALLDRTMDGSQKIIDNMFKMSWLDEQTRAIFLEVNLCNNMQSLISNVILMIEISATGKYIVKDYIRTMTTLDFSNIFVMILLLLLTALLILQVILFICHIVAIKRNESSKNILHLVLNVAIILFGFMFLILYIIKTSKIRNLMEEVRHSDQNGYISFMNAALWNDVCNIIGAGLVILSVLKLLNIFSCGVFKVVKYTFIIGFKSIVGLMLLLTITWIGFGLSGYVMFGSYTEDFRKVSESLFTVYTSTFVYFKKYLDFDTIDSIYPNLGRIYIIIFIVIKLTLVFLYISVLILAYKLARREIEIQKEFKIYYNSETRLQGGADRFDEDHNRRKLIMPDPILNNSLDKYFIENVSVVVLQDQIDKYLLDDQPEHLLETTNGILECLAVHKYSNRGFCIKERNWHDCCTENRHNDILLIMCYLLQSNNCPSFAVRSPLYNVHDIDRNTAFKLNKNLDTKIKELEEKLENLDLNLSVHSVVKNKEINIACISESVSSLTCIPSYVSEKSHDLKGTCLSPYCANFPKSNIKHKQTPREREQIKEKDPSVDSEIEVYYESTCFGSVTLNDSYSEQNFKRRRKKRK